MHIQLFLFNPSNQKKAREYQKRSFAIKTNAMDIFHQATQLVHAQYMKMLNIIHWKRWDKYWNQSFIDTWQKEEYQNANEPTE